MSAAVEPPLSPPSLGQVNPTSSTFDDDPPSVSRRHSTWAEVPQYQWDDWKWQQQNAIRSVGQLRHLLPFTGDELESIGKLEANYKLAIPPYYFSLINTDDPDDPIRLQSVPSPLENEGGFELDDPLEEEKDSPVNGLTHRYPDRVLMLTTPNCSMYCRFCTRKRVTLTRGGWEGISKNDELMIEYIRQHSEIKDVVVSGGDPLTLPIPKLQYYLDNLKAINDGHGHETGDELLARLAELLRATADTDQLAARLGGDEFCILMPYCSDTEAPARLAESLLACLAAQCFEIAGSAHRLSVSIGYALFPDHGADGHALVRAAGAALHKAKRDGRGRAVGATQVHASLLDESRSMEVELGDALRSGSLYLRWQRYVSVHDGGTMGYEALIRWQSQRFGEVSPSIFIPLAERTGLIGELDRFALQSACRTAASWPVPTRINVNVSPFWFAEGRIFEIVRDCLAETTLSPSRLLLEVTERTIIEHPAAARQQIQLLRDIGVHIALDDFGTGYSSLGAVSEFEIEQIKLDISLISKIGKDPRADGIARCVIQLARDLDLNVVAEGVETERQYELIRDLGCDAAQGFYLGRPDREIDFDVADNDGLPLSLMQWTPSKGMS